MEFSFFYFCTYLERAFAKFLLAAMLMILVCLIAAPHRVGAESSIYFELAPDIVGYGFNRVHWITSTNEMCAWAGSDAVGTPNGINSIRCFNPLTNSWRIEFPHNGPNFLANTDNHTSFYIPALNEFWKIGGSHLDCGAPCVGQRVAGVYNFTSHRWEATQTSGNGTSDFGLFCTAFASRIKDCVEGMGYHIDPAAAWASAINTGLVLGGAGLGLTGTYWLIVPNTTGGPEPYRLIRKDNPVFSGGPDLGLRAQCENCLVTDGTDFYLHGGFYVTFDGGWHFNRDLWKYTVATDTWTRLADAPDAHFTTMATYDTDRNEIVVWDHDPGAIGVVYVWDQATNRWQDRTPSTGIGGIFNQAGVYVPIIGSHLYIGGLQADPANNNDFTVNANRNVKGINVHATTNYEFTPVPPQPPGSQDGGGTTPVPPVVVTPSPPPVSTLQAIYLGSDQDRVGPGNQITPDGVADFHIAVSGLRSIPVKVTVTSDTGGVWETPFNGFNWIVATALTGTAGDFWFEPFNSNTFHVKVTYADGSTDETNAVTGATAPVGTLQAAFRGQDADVVGQGNQTTPDGVADFHISVSGVRANPVKATITSDTGGVWETPFNGFNWIIASQFAGTSGDLWFEPFNSNSFHVKLTYADGSTDESDTPGGAVSQSSGLQAVYVGEDQDVLGPIQLVPNGIPEIGRAHV